VYGGLAFSGGTLFGVGQDTGTSNGHLWTFDTTTGAATKVGTANSAFSQMLAFGDGTNLYGIDSSKRLYQINTSTAALTQMGTQPISGANLPTFFVGAVSITPVPEPGLMLGAAAAGLAGTRWLRRRASRTA
jgi:hypothetical protein